MIENKEQNDEKQKKVGIKYLITGQNECFKRFVRIHAMLAKNKRQRYGCL